MSSTYYHRILAAQRKDRVDQETQELTAGCQASTCEDVKSPPVTELSGSPEDKALILRDRTPREAIITGIQFFLLQIGKGYAFTARRERVRAKERGYIVDLVFL